MESPDKDEVEKRRDEALRRALTTPPKPHKPKEKKPDGDQKPVPRGN